MPVKPERRPCVGDGFVTQILSRTLVNLRPRALIHIKYDEQAAALAELAADEFGPLQRNRLHLAGRQ